MNAISEKSANWPGHYAIAPKASFISRIPRMLKSCVEICRLSFCLLRLKIVFQLLRLQSRFLDLRIRFNEFRIGVLRSWLWFRG